LDFLGSDGRMYPVPLGQIDESTARKVDRGHEEHVLVIVVDPNVSHMQDPLLVFGLFEPIVNTYNGMAGASKS
jgi:hypothetical protein